MRAGAQPAITSPPSIIGPHQPALKTGAPHDALALPGSLVEPVRGGLPHRQGKGLMAGFVALRRVRSCGLADR